MEKCIMIIGEPGKKSSTRYRDKMDRPGSITPRDKVHESGFGKFGWVTDPEGNRIELWQPPKGL